MSAENKLPYPSKFRVGEEVTVDGSYTLEGRKVTFGALGVVRKVKHTPKRGWRYVVELHDGELKWFYQKSVQKYKPKFVISSIL
jgi:hypothetical protein